MQNHQCNAGDKENHWCSARILEKPPTSRKIRRRETPKKSTSEIHRRSRRSRLSKKAIGTLVDEEDEAEAEETSSYQAENTKRRNRNHHVGATEISTRIKAGATPENSRQAASSRSTGTLAADDYLSDLH